MPFAGCWRIGSEDQLQLRGRNVRRGERGRLAKFATPKPKRVYRW